VTRVLRVDPREPEAEAVAEAVAVLRAGGLVAFPTETVYGLGAHALDVAAVQRIFDAKGRPSNDPLIVHIGETAHVTRVAREMPATALALAARFWPGPLTLILPKRAEVPSLVTAGLDTVGVRVPAHPVAHALLEQSGIPIAAPSANRFSRPSPTCAEHVLEDLDGRIDLVIDAGPTQVGIESTIVDVTVSPPLVRRPGGVSIEALRNILWLPDVDPNGGQSPQRDLRTVENSAENSPQVAPGQLMRHYAPRAALTLYEGAPDAVVAAIGADARRLLAQGQRVGILAPEEDLMALAPVIAAGAASGRILARGYGARRDPTRAAHELFASLRALDADGVECILASRPADTDIGRAIRDRLVRAAEGRVRTFGHEDV
jgi:L-threonylcarbamoyladenylate synthase